MTSSKRHQNTQEEMTMKTSTTLAIETRRGFPGTLERGRWVPAAIRGGADGDEPAVHPLTAELDADADRLFEEDARTLTRATEAAQKALAALLRSDGSPRLITEEHQAAVKNVLATFDGVAQLVSERTQAAAAAAERELVAMNGSDGWDRLSESEQAQASSRREFLKEDMESQPLHRLEPMIRGMLASGNRADLFLVGRYLAARVESMGPTDERRALSGLLQDVNAANADPQAAQKREKLEKRIRAAKWMADRPRTTRRKLDGSDARMLNDMRRQYAL